MLNKSFCGLEQSPRRWYKRFETFVTKIEFKRSSFNSCLYFNGEDNMSMVFLLLYVDDSFWQVICEKD